MLEMTFVQKDGGQVASRPSSKMSLFIEQKIVRVLKEGMRDDVVHAEEPFKGGCVPGMQPTDQSVYSIHTCLQNTPSEFFILYSSPKNPEAKSVIFKTFSSNLVIKTKTTNSSLFSCSSGFCLGCLGPSSCHMYTHESLEGSLRWLALALVCAHPVSLAPFICQLPFMWLRHGLATLSGRLHLVVAECSSITLPSSSEWVGSLSSVDLPRAL